ncbi:MAG: spermine synthase [Pseudohongiella sp.]|nr:spermine synthase [Pseudohongiella sp.]
MKLKDLFSDDPVLDDGKIVLSTSDDYGNILVVDYPRYRVLSFDSVYEQSGFYLERPYALAHEYTRIMLLVLGFIEPRHIILLGLGGGSLLRTLHHHLSRCHFHAVELRPKVYDIALEYFDIPDDNRVSVSIEDAALHMTGTKDASTDIIFADMYDAYRMSPILLQQQFVQACWRTLSKNGCLVINYHTMPDRHSPVFESLFDCFSTLLVCPCKSGNFILFASKSPRLDFDRAAAKLKKMEKTLDEVLMPSFTRLVQIIA